MSTHSDSVKFGGDCPFCPKKRMINDKNGKEFKTCFDCRTKCPNWLSCHGYRGKTKTNSRYATCPMCKFGEKYDKSLNAKAMTRSDSP